MLVLANTDGLGFNLHQFGQRVLQATGNGYGTTDGDVQFREFSGGQLGSGIHRSSGFVDHDFLDLATAAVDLLQHITNKFIGFPAAGTVTDSDQIHLMTGDQGHEHGFGFGEPVLGWGRVNRRVINHLAGLVNHRDLHTGTQSGIQADGGMRTGRSGQQQVFQVVGKHLDSGLFRTFS